MSYASIPRGILNEIGILNFTRCSKSLKDATKKGPPLKPKLKCGQHLWKIDFIFQNLTILSLYTKNMWNNIPFILFFYHLCKISYQKKVEENPFLSYNMKLFLCNVVQHIVPSFSNWKILFGMAFMGGIYEAFQHVFHYKHD